MSAAILISVKLDDARMYFARFMITDMAAVPKWGITMKLKHLDLFSGIGGFSLAADWVWGADHEIIGFCEQDRFCQKVLKKHWPDVQIYEDVKELDYETVMADASCCRKWKLTGKIEETCKPLYTSKREKSIFKFRSGSSSGNECETKQTNSINLITAGWPCQPFSVAGKQRGKEDDRHLWSEVIRIIRECRPRWFIGENVVGIVNMELDNCLSDLADAKYTTETFVIPACAVDAPHRRDRVWVVAYSSGTRRTRGKGCGEINRCDRRKEIFPQWKSKKSQWLPEPQLGRVANGIPSRVDRLKSLGNAIVPQCVQPIMEAIKEIEAEHIAKLVRKSEHRA